MNSLFKPFTPADTAFLLVDHQPGVIAMAQSVPAEKIARNAGMLGRLAEEMNIPLVITSTREEMEFLGTNIKQIQKSAPKAYEKRIRRTGTLNAFHDVNFKKAVESTGRKNLVIAGVLTDVCLFHCVTSAIELGYNVQVVADASGTSSALADEVTYNRLRSYGATVTTAYGILFELYSDLGKPEGQRAESIATAAARG